MPKYKKEIDIEKAIELYKQYGNINKVSKILNCNSTTLQRRFHDYGVNVKKSKYKGFDEEFFHNIDTEEKAYFFGLLMADGNNFTKSYRIVLSLADYDVKIVEKFRDAINSNYPIRLNKSNTKDYPNRHDRKYLQINSKIMSNRLEEIGCMNNKSLIIKFPKDIIPNTLMHHFIRGVFDGDGSISTCKNKKTPNYEYHIFNITGNTPFLLDIQEELIKNCKVNKTKLNSPKRYKNGTSMLCYGGSGNIEKIRSWLYKDATVYIERKYEKFFSINTKKNKHI